MAYQLESEGGNMKFENEISTIKTSIELSNFIEKLCDDLKDNPNAWSNNTLEDFLEALAAWITDMEGYYINSNQEVPLQPTWKTIAEMLLAAKIYE